MFSCPHRCEASWSGGSAPRFLLNLPSFQHEFLNLNRSWLKGLRPAVVIQFNPFANHTTVIVLPLTCTVTPASPLFRLPLVPSAENGLQAPSDLMVDRTMSVRSNKIGQTIGRVVETDILRINRALALFLGIAS